MSEINRELIAKTMNQIIQHPDKWDQTQWHCGTSHCFAGWAQILQGKPETSIQIVKDTAEDLGIDRYFAEWLFSGARTKGELYWACKSLLDGTLDRAGYDRAGYDRAGYNRAGYNRYGYDRDGYNRDGYNRAGYNRAGYDRYGYDRAGYNRAGYNRYGYDRDGYNRAGYDRDGSDNMPLLSA